MRNSRHKRQHTRSVKAQPRASRTRRKSIPLNAGSIPKKESRRINQCAENADLVQLSVRVPFMIRQAVHQAALDRGIKVQDLVVAALKAYGVGRGAGFATSPSINKNVKRRSPKAGPRVNIATNELAPCNLTDLLEILRQLTTLATSVGTRADRL